MTRRFFYTDPLAAAWMAKHHGMLVMPDVWTERYLSDAEAILTFTHPLREEFRGKWYVHPDSLPLLQSREGDLLQSTRGVMGGISSAFLLNKAWHANPEKWTVAPRYGDGSTLDKHWVTPSEWQTIIQRNGILFHWPQSEET